MRRLYRTALQGLGQAKGCWKVRHRKTSSISTWQTWCLPQKLARGLEVGENIHLPRLLLIGPLESRLQTLPCLRKVLSQARSLAATQAVAPFTSEAGGRRPPRIRTWKCAQKQRLLSKGFRREVLKACLEALPLHLPRLSTLKQASMKAFATDSHAPNTCLNRSNACSKPAAQAIQFDPKRQLRDIQGVRLHTPCSGQVACTLGVASRYPIH